LIAVRGNKSLVIIDQCAYLYILIINRIDVTAQRVLNAYCLDQFGHYEVHLRFNLPEFSKRAKRFAYRSADDVPSILIDSVRLNAYQ
jgi:hypothetical protein